MLGLGVAVGVTVGVGVALGVGEGVGLGVAVGVGVGEALWTSIITASYATAWIASSALNSNVYAPACAKLTSVVAAFGFAKLTGAGPE